MPLLLSAFASGLLFGVGLIVSQMVNPAKVIAFLDIFGNWDPSLAVVMAGAVTVSALGTALAKRRGTPVFALRLEFPKRNDIDARLLAGATLFGIGWGLVGFCPGPVVTALAFGPWQVAIFAVAMLGGMALFRFVPTEWPRSGLEVQTES